MENRDINLSKSINMDSLKKITINKLKELLSDDLLDELKVSIIEDNKFKKYKCVLWIYEPYNYNFDKLILDPNRDIIVDKEEYLEMENIILEHMPELVKNRNNDICLEDNLDECDMCSEDNLDKCDMSSEDHYISYKYALSIDQSAKLLNLLDYKYHKYLKIFKTVKYSIMMILHDGNRVIKCKTYSNNPNNFNHYIPYRANNIYITTFK